MTAKLESLSTLVRPDQAAALRAHSARTGVPLAACVRDALDLWLAAQREPRAASAYATSDERAADGVFAAAEVGR